MATPARPAPDGPARARRKRELHQLITELQTQPATGPAATLATHLEQLEHQHQHALTIATSPEELDTTAELLHRADTHALILTRTADLPALTRRAKLTRLPGPDPDLPRALRALTHRATAAQYSRTTGTGWALTVQTDGVTILIARADRRLLISRRTREAARNGRPPEIPPDIRAAILTAHAAGHNPYRIARELQHAGIPTVNGGPWRRETIRRITSRHPNTTPPEPAHERAPERPEPKTPRTGPETAPENGIKGPGSRRLVRPGHDAVGAARGS